MTFTRKLSRPGRLLAAIISFVLGAVFSVSLFAAPIDRTNAVWVLAKHSGILKLNQSDAVLQKAIDTLPARAEALAVDNQRFLIWIATKDRNLHAYSIDGVLQFSVPIPPNSTAEDDHQHKRSHKDKGDSKHKGDDTDLEHVTMVINETDGSVFLTEKKALYKFNATGAVAGIWPMGRKVRSLDFDQTRQILWVASKKGIVTYNSLGGLLKVIKLSDKNKVYDIDVDPNTGDLWVGSERQLRRYSTNGTLLLNVPAKHLRHLAATGNGNVWASTEKYLKLYSATGALLKTVRQSKRKGHHNGSGHAEDLAANTDDHSAWLLNKRAVVHVSAAGTLLHISNWTRAKLEGLTLSFDRIAPTITITSPADAALVRPTTAINLSYTDQGSGIDTATLKFTVNDQAATFTCTHTATAATANFATIAGTAVCNASKPYSTAAIKITVNAKDYAGNAAPTQTINVKLDTDGDGHSDDVDAFPNDPNEWSDIDGDGIGDNSDPDKDGDGYPNDKDAFPEDSKEWKDTDSDGIGDNADPDIDNDGHANASDAFPTDATEWADLDKDGIGDNSDPDKDGDGYNNDVDLFPTDPGEWADIDGDGIGNNSDVDRDGDGYNNDVDTFPDDPLRWKLPVIKIISPATLTTVGASPVSINGTVDDAAATITVNGVPVSSGGSFSAQVALTEGFNSIIARAVDAQGAEATASIVVTLDTTPPHVTVQAPQDGDTVTTNTITVTGLVNDIVRGTVAADQANVTVNGVLATVSNRSYLAQNVPLQPGANTLTVTAADAVGNTETKTITITFTPIVGPKITIQSGSNQTGIISSGLPNTLQAKVTDAAGNALAGREVIFRVIQGDGLVKAGSLANDRATAATTNSQGIASATFTLGTRAGQGNHRVRATAIGIEGEAVFHASANPAPGDKVSIIDGNNQRGAILSDLPKPLTVAVSDNGANLVQGAEVVFTVSNGSGTVGNGQRSIIVTTDSDGRASTMYKLGREVGLDEQRVTVILKGTLATAGFTASGLQPGDPGQTKISGVVLNNQDVPLPGVTIRVEGTTRQAETDGHGQFVIDQVPVGPVRLLVEGQTTSITGDWPTLSYDVVTVAGANNTLPAPIYLVPLNTLSAKIVGDKDVTLTLAEVPGFKLEVKAGSVTFPDGSKTGKLSATTVNSSKIPMPPPNGMQPQFIVTIQPAGAMFDPPARLTLPNVDGYKPGAEVEMFSYDHDLEEFVTIGWGTVANDGSTITSNVGVGVVKAGWHCGTQPAEDGIAICTPNYCPECENGPKDDETATDETDSQGGIPSENSFTRYYRSSTGRWTHTYQRYIRRVEGESIVRAVRHDSNVYYFQLKDGIWKAQGRVDDQLERLEDANGVTTGWRYITKGSWIEEYNETGLLQTLTNSQGFTRTMEYDDATGLLSGYTYASGRRVRLYYDAYQRLSALMNPSGQITRYTYNAKGNLEKVYYPDETLDDDTDNPFKQYHYENTSFPSHLTGITNENGVRKVTYTYNIKGQRSGEDRPGQSNFTLKHLDNGDTELTDSRSLTHTYKYKQIAGDRRLVEVVGPPCLSCGDRYRKIGYDANANQIRTEDFNGIVTTYTYNSRNLQTSRTEAMGTPEQRTFTTEWHATLRRPIKITKPGRVTSISYDDQGHVLSRSISDPTSGKSRTTAYTYNTKGLLEKVDGPRTDVNDITTYEYDETNVLVRATNTLGHTTEVLAIDGMGRVLATRDANGLTTNIRHDARGRIVEHIVGGSVTKMDYDNAGNIISMILPDNSQLTYGYDNNSRLISISDNAGNMIAYTLDADGNRTAENTTDEGGNLTKKLNRVYNEFNQLAEIIGGENQSTGYSYDAQGNRTAMADPLTRTSRFGYDPLNRLKSVLDPENGTISYGYDDRDNLVLVKDPRGLTTTYTYDGLANKIQQNSPDTGTTYYAYDSASNMTAITDAKNQNIFYKYDAANRLTFIDYPGTADDVTFIYDVGVNSLGRLSRVINASGVTEYGYDVRGNLIRQSYNNDTVLYAYDVENRIIGMTYPSGRRVAYAYDSLGRVATISTTDSTGNTIVLANEMTYQPFGHRTGLSYGNGLALKRNFDLDGRLTAQNFIGSAGTVQSLQFIYNAANNITNKANLVDPTRTQAFSYDDLDRLVTASGTYGNIGYSYDSVGNRLTKTNTTGADNYGYEAASNRLTSINGQSGATSYQYDANGNTTLKNNEQFIYNAENRLVEYRSGTEKISYTYNVQGLRTVKDSVLGRTRFVYDRQGQMIGEYSSAASVKEYIYLDGEPLATIDNNKIYYIHNDHLSTPQQMTNQVGTVVWGADYKPFGEVTLTTNAIENNLRFSGQYYDAQLGNHYNWNRYYDPKIGRYITSDPIGLDGGLNTYGYVGGNPGKRKDPRGLDMGYDPYEMPNDLRPFGGPFGEVCGTQDSPWARVLPDFYPKECADHDDCYDKATDSCQGYDGKEACDNKLPLSFRIGVKLGGKSTYEDLLNEKGCPGLDCIEEGKRQKNTEDNIKPVGSLTISEP